jgi:phthiocerol/phenolphthiocerol synthesis type-I polyketide synthase D
VTPQLRTPQEIAAFVSEWLASELDTTVNEIPLDEPFAAIGASSLALAALAGELEERIGCELPASVAWEHPTIARLAAFLSTQVAPAGGERAP